MTPEQRKWRLFYLKHLEGLAFRLLHYQAPTAEWDHDHCFGCNAKFAEFDDPEIEHEG